jgi:DNA-binding NtrC family response regulator
MARILVADDEESVRSFVARALELHEHEVTTASDGGEALDLALQDEFDLLLTDIRMPVMDGIALALNVTAKRPNLPVLLMTGYATEEQRAHNLDRLIAGIISKPFTLEQIIEVVNRTLERQAG